MTGRTFNCYKTITFTRLCIMASFLWHSVCTFCWETDVAEEHMHMDLVYQLASHHHQLSVHMQTTNFNTLSTRLAGLASSLP